MYDTETKNLSFIKIYKKLKNLGIKNNKFFLWLNDDTLQGVNPYSKHLTEEQKLRIYNEVCTNYWYYLREVVRIPEAGGITKFKLNRGNLAQSFLMEQNINLIEILPRQQGKTIGADSRYSWVYNFGTINTNMIFGNKQLADSQNNIKRFNDIVDLLPSYLKVHLNPALDTNNLNEISCTETNNDIKALSTPRDINSAEKLGHPYKII